MPNLSGQAVTIVGVERCYQLLIFLWLSGMLSARFDYLIAAATGTKMTLIIASNEIMMVTTTQ